MEGFGGSDLLKLAEILKPKDADDEFDDEQRVKPNMKPKKEDIAKPKIIRDTEKEDAQSLLNKIETEYNEGTDWRKCPEWNLIYKQSVTPSDVYLQMGGKTQLTSSCEEIVITVKLPGEKSAGIEVKVTKVHLDLLATNFKLSIPLPHPVDPQKGNAKWDSITESLVLTLVMDREFDFVNF